MSKAKRSGASPRAGATKAAPDASPATAAARPRVPKRIATVIVNSLKGGVVPRVGLPYITVGREAEIAALLRDLEIVADGGASCRFVVGRGAFARVIA